MRGARTPSASPSAPQGIIPADAGSTSRLICSKRRSKDHPRGCGEHACCHRCLSECSGSSPRMRGALPHRLLRNRTRRIIPADAGSTCEASADDGGYQDHPRGCGEHTELTELLGTDSGSSPRMRGAPGDGHQPPAAGRIIPADAGSTLRNPCNPNNIIDKISIF